MTSLSSQIRQGPHYDLDLNLLDIVVNGGHIVTASLPVLKRYYCILRPHHELAKGLL